MNISKDDFITALDTYFLIVEKLEALVVNLSFKGLADKEIIQRIEGIAYTATRRKEFLAGRYFPAYKTKSASLTCDVKNDVESEVIDNGIEL